MNAHYESIFQENSPTVDDSDAEELTIVRDNVTKLFHQCMNILESGKLTCVVLQSPPNNIQEVFDEYMEAYVLFLTYVGNIVGTVGKCEDVDGDTIMPPTLKQ